jgi:23S rRNA pseudouridine955/2504/2580 synthase/23S rRNA pseudouridine1911/1915/1917 synthase
VKKPDVIFENEDFIAINKAPGMLSIPDRHDDTQLSLSRMLTIQFGKIYVVHRLDRDTSGIILFAKNEHSHKYLSAIFEKRTIQKIYTGIVKGSMPSSNGIIDEPIMEHPFRKGEMTIHKKGKLSRTEYEVVNDFGIYSLVKFIIHTGRTHQIRVHAQHIGHPLVGDKIYGDGKPVLLSSFKKRFNLKEDAEEKPLLNRLALHAASLNFKNENGEEFSLEAPLPKDMYALVEQLKKSGRSK